MSSKKISFPNERIARYLYGKVNDESWAVEDAKARLTRIMRLAREGMVQVVGKQDPVIVISMTELEKMLEGFREPETWGERFFPQVRTEDFGEDLELPASERTVRNSYDINAEYGEHPDEGQGVVQEMQR